MVGLDVCVGGHAFHAVSIFMARCAECVHTSQPVTITATSGASR